MRSSLFDCLLAALRAQPNVRLAVVFGSVARGNENARSDLDLLVELRNDGSGARAELREHSFATVASSLTETAAGGS